jgi:hypothetical protein
MRNEKISPEYMFLKSQEMRSQILDIVNKFGGEKNENFIFGAYKHCHDVLIYFLKEISTHFNDEGKAHLSGVEIGQILINAINNSFDQLKKSHAKIKKQLDNENE